MRNTPVLLLSVFLINCSQATEKIEITCSGVHKKTQTDQADVKDNFSQSFEIVKMIHEVVIHDKTKNVNDWVIKQEDGDTLYTSHIDLKHSILNHFTDSKLKVDKNVINYNSIVRTDTIEKNKELIDSIIVKININRNTGEYYKYTQMYNSFTMSPYSIVHEYNGTCIKSEKRF